MAIQADYQFEVNQLKHVVENSYIRIIKIVLEFDDVEIYETVPENTNNIEQILKYDKRLAARAITYVYADKSARDNHAYPIHSFVFEFKYDLTSVDNAFIQGYNKLKTLTHIFIKKDILDL